MNRTESTTKLTACFLASLLVISVLAMTTAVAGASSGTNQGTIAGNVALGENVEMPAEGGLSVTVVATDEEGQPVEQTTSEITTTDPNFQYEFLVPAGGYRVNAKLTDSTGDVVTDDYSMLDVGSSGDYVWLQDDVTISDVDFDVIDFESVQIRHERSGSGTSRTDSNDELPTFAQELQIEMGHGETFAIGGDTDRGVRIRDIETGDEVTVVPKTDTTYRAAELEFRGIYNNDGSFKDSPKLDIRGPGIDDGFVDATYVNADTNVFDRSVFQAYEIELLAHASTDSPTVVDTTKQRIVGIGYEGALTQDSTHGTIEFTFPRIDEVDETWDVEFELADPDADSQSWTKSVAHTAGDDMFSFQLDVSDIESGDYHWQLNMYPAEPQFSDERTPGDLIIGLFDVEGITIERATFEVAPAEPDVDEPITFDASDSVGLNGDIAKYVWNFGDGTTETTTEPTFEHTYDTTGDFEVQLTVVDGEENKETTTQTVSVDDTITVTGAFTESDGEPAADDTIVVLPENDFFSTTTDANGAFSIDLPTREAPYDIQYYQGDVESGDLSAAFPNDDSVDIFATAAPGTEDTDLGAIDLPNGHQIDVTVTDEAGAPVEGAWITWSDHDSQSAATGGYTIRTNADGIAEAGGGTVVKGLELAGSAEVIVSPPDGDTRFADRSYTESLDVTQADSLTVTLESAADDSDDEQDSRDRDRSRNSGSSSGTSDNDTKEPKDDTADDESTDGHGYNVSATETVNLEDVAPDVPGRTVRTENTSVTEITFDEADDAGATGGNVTVSDIDAPPAEIGAPEGMTVGSIEISVPEELRNTAATVQVTVDRERLADLDAAEDELTVQRFNESAGEWQTLETTVVESSKDQVVLGAETPGFSYFAVTAPSEDAQQSTPTETETETPASTASDDATTVTETETETNSPSDADDMAGFGAVVALVALLAAALLAARRR